MPLIVSSLGATVTFISFVAELYFPVTSDAVTVIVATPTPFTDTLPESSTPTTLLFDDVYVTSATVGGLSTGLRSTLSVPYTRFRSSIPVIFCLAYSYFYLNVFRLLISIRRLCAYSDDRCTFTINNYISTCIY